MPVSSSLTEQLANMGVEINLPAWPEETDSDNTTGDWIRHGKAYAEGLQKWRERIREAPVGSRKVLEQVLQYINQEKQLDAWNQLLHKEIKKNLEEPEENQNWRSCTKLIRLSELSPAQVLGITIDQANIGNFETARQGVNRLSEAGLLDRNLTHHLCSNLLLKAIENLPKTRNLAEGNTSELIDKHIAIIKYMRDYAAVAIQENNNDGNKMLNRLTLHSANPTILIAGMRHSGSTALFNIVRIGFELSGKEVIGSYSEHSNIDDMTKGTSTVNITKIHEYRADHCQRADLIITTRRDLRDTVASAKRRGFYLIKNVGGDVQYAAYNRSLHEAWHDKSDYEMSYDDLMSNPVQTIKNIFALLGINQSLADQVAKLIKELPTNNYSKTLLSDTHITDPKHILTFRESLESNDIKSINERNEDWLEYYSYI